MILVNSDIFNNKLSQFFSDDYLKMAVLRFDNFINKKFEFIDKSYVYLIFNENFKKHFQEILLDLQSFQIYSTSYINNHNYNQCLNKQIGFYNSNRKNILKNIKIFYPDEKNKTEILNNTNFSSKNTSLDGVINLDSLLINKTILIFDNKLLNILNFKNLLKSDNYDNKTNNSKLSISSINKKLNTTSKNSVNIKNNSINLNDEDLEKILKKKIEDFNKIKIKNTKDKEFYEYLIKLVKDKLMKFQNTSYNINGKNKKINSIIVKNTSVNDSTNLTINIKIDYNTNYKFNTIINNTRKNSSIFINIINQTHDHYNYLFKKSKLNKSNSLKKGIFYFFKY